MNVQEDPPHSLPERAPDQSPTRQLRQFSPLVDAEWTAIAMTYLRELGALAARRRELYDEQPPTALRQ